MSRAEPLTVAIDPLELSVLAHGVAMIAEEMGAVLVRSALSPNIRERRDASAALFDARGRMIAQAAHIPVHLGAMPEAVSAVLARDPQPGDVFLLNDPYHGGSHLPDLTLVEAVGVDDVIVGFTAVRAHHADDRAFLGDRDGRVAQLRRARDEFFRVRSADQKAEVRAAMQFGIGRQGLEQRCRW